MQILKVLRSWGGTKTVSRKEILKYPEELCFSRCLYLQRRPFIQVETVHCGWSFCRNALPEIGISKNIRMRLSKNLEWSNHKYFVSNDATSSCLCFHQLSPLNLSNRFVAI